MPVEIRELKITGKLNSSGIDQRFNQINSPILTSKALDQLRKEIIAECTDKILEKLERSKYR